MKDYYKRTRENYSRVNFALTRCTNNSTITNNICCDKNVLNSNNPNVFNASLMKKTGEKTESVNAYRDIGANI